VDVNEGTDSEFRRFLFEQPPRLTSSGDTFIGPFVMDIDTGEVKRWQTAIVDPSTFDMSRLSVEKLYQQGALFSYEPPPPEHNLDHSFAKGVIKTYDGTIFSYYHDKRPDPIGHFSFVVDGGTLRSLDLDENGVPVPAQELRTYLPADWPVAFGVGNLLIEHVQPAVYCGDYASYIVDEDTNETIYEDALSGLSRKITQKGVECTMTWNYVDPELEFPEPQVAVGTMDVVTTITVQAVKSLLQAGEASYQDFLDDHESDSSWAWGAVVVDYSVEEEHTNVVWTSNEPDWGQDTTHGSEIGATGLGDTYGVPIRYSMTMRHYCVTPALINQLPSFELRRNMLQSFEFRLRDDLNILWGLTPSDASFLATIKAVNSLRICNVNGLEFAKDMFAIRELVTPVLRLLRNPVSPKNWASLVLWWMYGVKPTWRDSRALLKALTSIRRASRSALGYIKFKNSLHSKYGTYTCSIQHDSFGVVKHRTNERVVARLELPIEETPRACLQAMMEDMGLLVNLQNVWDTLTLTFVVDWFVNIGYLFEQMDYSAECDRYKLRERIGSHKNIVETSPHRYLFETGLYGSLHLETYSRTYFDYLPDPPWDTGDPSFFQSLDRRDPAGLDPS